MILPTHYIPLLMAYLLGSIPCGYLLTKIFRLGDIRNIGSGNIGATNVLRTGNKKIALLTLLGDCLKGTAAILFAYWFSRHILPLHKVDFGYAALWAMLGHMFPIWLKFSGGKGVATYLGTLLALCPFAAVVFLVVWIVCAYITRYSSLAAIVAVAVIPIFIYFFDDKVVACLYAIMTILVILKHHTNIARLLKGTESKIGEKANAI